MPDYPEINCPNAYALYHGKGVLFRSKPRGTLTVWEGRFFVALNSRWMRIDVIVESTPTQITEEHLPLTDEIVRSIQPAPIEVIHAYEGRIAFLIPQVLTLPTQ